MSLRIARQMECYFVIFGAVVGVTLLILAAFFTPNYDPRINTISSLGYRIAKSLFSIAFVLFGTTSVPFFIYLERELMNIKENVRKLATGFSLFTSICVGMVGIIPDETYHDIFLAFHIFVATFAFFGSCIYITLYSILMYYGPKSKMYVGRRFKKILAYFGFGLNILLIALFISAGLEWEYGAFLEWCLFGGIFIWLLSTAVTLIQYRFFNIEGMYYKKSQYDEALQKFEESLKILNELSLSNHPIANQIQKNIEFLLKEQERKKK